MADFETTFWGQVDRTGECWTWRGGCGNGHPHLYVRPGVLPGCAGGRQFPASRVAWALSGHDWPEGALYRTCGNRLCVRPEHLTPQRQSRVGTQRTRRRLTDDDAAAIRASDATQEALARQYGVLPATVAKVRAGATHKAEPTPQADGIDWAWVESQVEEFKRKLAANAAERWFETFGDHEHHAAA